MISRSRAVLYCHFCGKAQGEVFTLIAGPTAFICDECVELCVDIVREKREDAALAKIGSACRYTFDIDEPEKLDFWCEFYKIRKREPGETDEHLRGRIRHAHENNHPYRSKDENGRQINPTKNRF